MNLLNWNVGFKGSSWVALFSFLTIISISYQFYLGTLFSSLIPFVILLLIFILYPNTKFTKKTLLLVLFFSLVVGYSLFRFILVSDGLNTSFIRLLQYMRGAVIAASVYFCMSRDFEKSLTGFKAACVLTLMHSSLLLFFWYFFPSLYLYLSPDFDRSYRGFTGLYHNPNYWAIVCMTICFLLISYEGFVRQRFDAWFLFLMFLLVFMTISTASRMGLIFCLIFILYLSFYKRLYKRLSFFIVFLMVSLLILFNVEQISTSSVYLKILGKLFTAESSTGEEARLSFLLNYVDHFIRKPGDLFFGMGLSNHIEGIPSAHNSILTFIIDFGFILFLFLLLFFIYMCTKIVLSNSQYKEMGVLGIYLLSALSLTNDFQDTRGAWVVIGLVYYSYRKSVSCVRIENKK